MKWIKCSDRLPDNDRNVMGYTSGRTARMPVMCYYDEDAEGFIALFSQQEIIVRIDYWMEMPEDPEERKK